MRRHFTKPDACACGGETAYFPSSREGDRYTTLRRKEQYGRISCLQVHPPFPIEIGGKKVTTYYADFLYFNENGMVIEDVKATKNPKGQDPVFKLKKSLAEALHGITVTIVT